jgi:hypothetical protein
MLIRNKEIEHLSYAERSLYKWINKKHNKNNIYESWIFGEEEEVERVYRIGKAISYYEYSVGFNTTKDNQMYDVKQQQKYRSRRNQW